MPSSEERRRHREQTTAFLAGERIFGIKFRHNSHVAFVRADGTRCDGWIVGVGPIEPEPVYTVECSDGTGDEEVVESKIELILDPHENSAT